MVNDSRAERRRHALSDQWTRHFWKELDSGRLERWLSSFKDGMPCTVLPDTISGTFNFCSPVLFEDGTKYMTRFPLPGRTIDADEKTIREAGTMAVVAGYTSIPIPKLRHWGLSKDNPTGLGPFLIMDYMEGINLRKLWTEPSSSSQSKPKLRSNIPEADLRTVYRQLARYYLELSKNKYKKQASFGYTEDKKIEPLPFLSLKMNEMEVYSGVRVGGGRKLRSKSADFFQRVVRQNMVQLLDQDNSVQDSEDARNKYIAQKQIEAAVPAFAVPDEDSHVFRAFCDDFQYRNILVKSATNLTVTAFIDWEWTYTAPWQMFCSPPSWLALRYPSQWEEGDQSRYESLLNLFLEELALEENAESLRDGPKGGKDSLSPPRSPSQLGQASTQDHDDFTMGAIAPEQSIHARPVLTLHTIAEDDADTSNGDGTTISSSDSNEDSDEHTPRASTLPALTLPVPYPNFSQPLSEQMRHSYASGRFWFYELLQISEVKEHNRPWEELTKRYPYLLELYKVDEDKVQSFVRRKMRKLEDYRRDVGRLRRREQRQQEARLRAGQAQDRQAGLPPDHHTVASSETKASKEIE